MTALYGAEFNYFRIVFHRQPNRQTARNPGFYGYFRQFLPFRRPSYRIPTIYERLKPSFENLRIVDKTPQCIHRSVSGVLRRNQFRS